MKKLVLGVIIISSAIGVSLIYQPVLKPALYGLFNPPPVNELETFDLEKRPGVGMLLFDYAGILIGSEEGIDRYLKGIGISGGIEMVVVTLPSISDIKLQESIEEAAFRLFNNWEIGKEYGGQGILVLMVEDIGEVKIEVANGLEDVFTDLFSGVAADKQLKPHLEQGTIGFALVAIMEEFEQRAYIKKSDNYTPQLIAERDRKFLSIGAGVQRELDDYDLNQKHDASSSEITTSDKKGATTPEQAWEIIISKWLGEGKYQDYDIHTQATDLISGDQNKLKYSWAKMYKAMNYRVIQDGNYAVISFGKKKGWDNSPIFLIKTANPEGWKMDFVNQRKYVVMGAAPYWKVERGNHPYVYQSAYAWQDTAKDLPIDIDDLYSAGRDATLARQYQQAVSHIKENPNDFDAAMQAGRLGTIMALLPKDIHPYLNQAEKLNLQSPLPHKYKAINAIESNYQYKTALIQIRKFLEKGGNPVFGNNFLGYMLVKTGDRDGGMEAFKKSLQYGYDNLDDISEPAERERIIEQAMYSLDRLVRIYNKQGNGPKMIAIYEEMKLIAPNHWRVFMNSWVEKFKS